MVYNESNKAVDEAALFVVFSCRCEGGGCPPEATPVEFILSWANDAILGRVQSAPVGSF